jgi:hypothetical protein
VELRQALRGPGAHQPARTDQRHQEGAAPGHRMEPDEADRTPDGAGAEGQERGDEGGRRLGAGWSPYLGAYVSHSRLDQPSAQAMAVVHYPGLQPATAGQLQPKTSFVTGLLVSCHGSPEPMGKR